MKNRLAMAAMGVFVIWVNRRSPIFSFDLFEGIACLGLLAMCVIPMLLWLRDGMKTLPVFEIFCLLHFLLFVSPYLEGRPQFMQYPIDVRLQCVMIVCTFLGAAYAIYYGWVRGSRDRPLPQKYFQRWLPEFRQSGVFWVMLGAWWLFTFAFTTRLISNTMPLLNPLRSICTPMGVMAIFYFNLMSGRRRLSFFPEAITVLAIASGVLLSIAGGTLVFGIFLIIIALLGFTLGRRRVPMFATLACVALINFLHLGKHEVRAKYWAPEIPEIGASTMLNPVDVYSLWIATSWERLFAADIEEEEKTTIFKRANLLWVLAIVADETPDQRPFLLGETYAQIPALFVPRYFNRDKARGSLPTETLGIYYGIQTEESVNSTSISFGPIAEAWANFGWLGVIAVGVVYGFVSLAARRLVVGAQANNVGFLLAVVITGQIVDLENALGTILISTVQALGMAAIMLYFVSKPADRENGPESPLLDRP